jgi:hypothetical protein
MTKPTLGRDVSPKRPFPPKHGRLGEASLPNVGFVASSMRDACARLDASLRQPCRFSTRQSGYSHETRLPFPHEQ